MFSAADVYSDHLDISCTDGILIKGTEYLDLLKKKEHFLLFQKYIFPKKRKMMFLKIIFAQPLQRQYLYLRGGYFQKLKISGLKDFVFPLTISHASVGINNISAQKATG